MMYLLRFPINKESNPGCFYIHMNFNNTSIFKNLSSNKRRHIVKSCVSVIWVAPRVSLLKKIVNIYIMRSNTNLGTSSVLLFLILSFKNIGTFSWYWMFAKNWSWRWIPGIHNIRVPFILSCILTIFTYFHSSAKIRIKYFRSLLKSNFRWNLFLLFDIFFVFNLISLRF